MVISVNAADNSTCQGQANLKASSPTGKLVSSLLRTGSVIRGGSRGRVQGMCNPPPPPEMTCLLLHIRYENLFTSGHQSVTPFLSGALVLKKNPGSAPGLTVTVLNMRRMQVICD